MLSCQDAEDRINLGASFILQISPDITEKIECVFWCTKTSHKHWRDHGMFQKPQMSFKIQSHDARHYITSDQTEKIQQDIFTQLRFPKETMSCCFHVYSSQCMNLFWSLDLRLLFWGKRWLLDQSHFNINCIKDHTKNTASSSGTTLKQQSHGVPLSQLSWWLMQRERRLSARSEEGASRKVQEDRRLWKAGRAWPLGSGEEE